MYVRGLQYEDLYRALEYLGKMDFESGDEIINEALFNSALILLVKCFTSSKESRNHINPDSVFPEKENNDKPREVWNKFKDFRDEYIAHDQEDYKKARVGLVINTEKKIVENVVAPYVKSHFNYQINAQMLARLINMALNYVESDIDKNIENILRYYRNLDFEEIERYSPVYYADEDDDI